MKVAKRCIAKTLGLPVWDPVVIEKFNKTYEVSVWGLRRRSLWG